MDSVIRADGGEARLRRSAERMVHTFLSGMVCIGAVLPVALAAGSGPIKVVGVTYAVLYGLMLLLTSAPYLYLLLDAVLISFKKFPVFLPVMIAFARRQQPDHQRRMLGGVSRLAKLAILANPLANLAVVAVVVAARIQPKWFARIWDQAATPHAPVRVTLEQPIYADPSTEINRPIFEIVRRERELLHC